jgi:Transposase
MLGFGPPANRQARCEWWRRQIQRQREGTLSIAEFCRRLGVSTVTFYAWKRRFREVPTTPSHPSERISASSTRTTNGPPTAAFLPVVIPNAGPAGQIEITLANSCVLRLTGAVDPELLRIAIRAAGRRNNGRRGAE